MKILITGATGYLGSEIVKYLIKHNHKIVILKRTISSMEKLKQIKKNLICYNLDSIDLSTPFVEQGNFDLIIHTATCYGKKGEKKKEIFEANTLFPIKLLETSIYYNTKLFINTDTYYNTKQKECEYLSNYVLSKKKFIKSAKSLALKKKIKIINMRLEHVYGPSDSNSKFVNWLVSSLCKGDKNIKLTKGEQQRDLIFINDVVNAYSVVLKNISKIKGYYTDIGVGSGDTIMLKDFVELAHKLSKSKSKLIFGSIPYQKNEIMISKADNKILKNFNWNCKFDIKKGLNQVIKFI